ncbi:tyrosinase family protein [Pedobacter sp. 22226]|uniref:tyrosinase family protein n=1 Tax=Pedobacter sp. 22226 TaxID=3453894 RepID=UPI003F856819
MKPTLKVRRSIQNIYNDFNNGKPEELEKLMVAWQFIKALPADNPNSFMTLGGFHGEPFVGRGAYDGSYWGGYCNHGNILFPTWHRAYLHKLEKALQSVPGCESVMLPYWDQTYKITKPDGSKVFLGVPPILTDEYFTFSNNVTIPNPLKSFVLPVALHDYVEVSSYSKPQGYETVRYPLSGLVGRPTDRAAAELNNSAYYIPGTNTINVKLTTQLLNDNVIGWLGGTVEIPDQFNPDNPFTPVGKFRGGVYDSYKKSLDAPCYTVFSNNTSRSEWNDPKYNNVNAQSLESPHGSIHLSVGGVNMPGQDANPNSPNPNVPSNANGDMGENETAGLDPIFFFHHCNVDRIFWMWQKKHNSTTNLDLSVPGFPADQQYPGTNNEGQQPPVGYEPGEQLTMDSPLFPFKLVENGQERYYRSSDVFDIENQLGFTYESLSLDDTDQASELKLQASAPQEEHKSDKVLTINGINRAKINGSFVLSAYATIDGVRHFLGAEPVLSRWRVVACKNCLTHLEVSASFTLYQFTEDEIARAIFDVQINGRSGNEAEFAKFTVANQANANKLLTARAPGNMMLMADSLGKGLAAEAPMLMNSSAFNMQVS